MLPAQNVPGERGGGFVACERDRPTAFQIPEPGTLTFGELTRPGSNQLTNEIAIGMSRGKSIEDLFIPKRLLVCPTDPLRPGSESATTHPTNPGEHRVDPPIDPLVQPRPRRIEPVDVRWRDISGLFRLPVTEGPTGRGEDFHTARVTRCRSCGWRRAAACGST